MKKSLFLLLNILVLTTVSWSQQYAKSDFKAYIARYSQLAIKEMKIYRIPASITLAQGIIESNCGKSPLAVKANNHFGIKCHREWTGEGFYYDDDQKNECFRKYLNPEDSFRDHSLFLTLRPRYAALFSLDPKDYTGWAYGLKQAGYATNPEYPRLLIRVIEDNRLFELDKEEIEEEIAEKAQPEEIQIVAKTVVTAPRKSEHVLFYENFQMPDPAKFEQKNTSSAGRKIYENNGIPFIFAKKGDNWINIASEFGIYAFQVYRQNDLKGSDPITPGQILYLESKRRKAAVDSHIASDTDSMYSISQQYGVKIKFLYRYNNMLPGQEPKPGVTILLRKKWSFF